MVRKKVKEILEKYILNNLGWKIFSFVLAVIMWYIVMNIINPTETKVFTTTVILKDEQKLIENGFAILNKNELENIAVEIKARGSRPALDELTNRSGDIVAFIDADDINMEPTSENKYVAKIDITLPENMRYMYDIISTTPNTAFVELDNKISEDKVVTIDLTGSAADGYVSMAPVITPPKVNVTGLSNVIGDIGSIKVVADISNLTSDYNENLKPVVYDKDGNILSGVTLGSDTVNVEIKINKKGHIPISAPKINGAPANNYRITDIEYEPKFIEATGTEEDFKKIPQINLPIINIDGESEDRIVKFDVRPFLSDTNLVLHAESPSEITVRIKIEAEKISTLNIPMSQISISGYSDTYELEFQDSVKLSVKGEVPDNFDTALIKGNIDLSGVNEGTHFVKVTFDIPQELGLTQIGESSTIIKIINSAEITTEENSTESEEQTDTNETTVNEPAADLNEQTEDL
ncbi:MAG: hypothetical protein IJ583_10185 [Firmicutes bacterium]|nr:hypothetical protein [Bacillota bacterium]